MTEKTTTPDPLEYARRQPNILRARAEKPGSAAHMEAAANTIETLLAEVDALTADKLTPKEAYDLLVAWDYTFGPFALDAPGMPAKLRAICEIEPVQVPGRA
jgi:hypothetical protein